MIINSGQHKHTHNFKTQKGCASLKASTKNNFMVTGRTSQLQGMPKPINTQELSLAVLTGSFHAACHMIRPFNHPLFAFSREGPLFFSVVWWLVGIVANRLGFTHEGGLLVVVWWVSSRRVWWGIMRERWCLVRGSLIWSRFRKALTDISYALTKSHQDQIGYHNLSEKQQIY